MQVGSGQPQVVPQSASIPVAKAPPSSSTGNDDVIDKASFFSSSTEKAEQRAPGKPKSTWVCADLRPVPAFYPLEKSSRFVDDEKDMVTDRLAECLRVLSVQADFNNEVVRSIWVITWRRRSLPALLRENRQFHGLKFSRG